MVYKPEVLLYTNISGTLPVHVQLSLGSSLGTFYTRAMGEIYVHWDTVRIAI